jgi:hypothetical protein
VDEPVQGSLQIEVADRRWNPLSPITVKPGNSAALTSLPPPATMGSNKFETDFHIYDALLETPTGDRLVQDTERYWPPLFRIFGGPVVKSNGRPYCPGVIMYE